MNFDGLYEFFFPFLLLSLIVFTTIYLRDKEDFKRQLQMIKAHKWKITLTILLVLLIPLGTLLVVYLLKNIAELLNI